MNFLRQAEELVRKLQSEETSVPVIYRPEFQPIERRGFYVCRGCQKTFTDIAAIRRHEGGFCHAAR